jgi:hypothetical protein
MNLDIVNGTVVDPASGPSSVRSLYIRDGKVTIFARSTRGPG